MRYKYPIQIIIQISKSNINTNKKNLNEEEENYKYQIQSHLNLLNYTHWSRLNTLYFTQVFVITYKFVFVFVFLLKQRIVSGPTYQPQLPRGTAGNP